MMKVGQASAGHVVERAAVEADRPPLDAAAWSKWI